MSDFHHYRLGLHEQQEALSDKQIKQAALEVADAALEAICNKLDLQGNDWELMHQEITNRAMDALA